MTFMDREEQIFQAALASLNQKKIGDAERLFRDLIKIQPKHVPGLNLLTVLLMSMERFAEAEEFIERAVALNERSDVSFYNYGIILKRLGKPAQAKQQFDKALHLNSKIHETWNNRGTVFNDLKQYDQAVSDFDRAISLNPNYVDAFCNKGKSLTELRRFDDAFAAFDKALTLKPDLAEAWLGRSSILFNLRRYDEALLACDKALALKPGLAEAWLSRGHILNRLKRHDEAAKALAEVLKVAPQHPFAKGMLLHQKMLSCDWTDVDALIAEIDEDVVSGKLSAEPFGWQGVAKSPRSLQLCAELYNRHNFPDSGKVATGRPVVHRDRIRIGYLSGELRDQATSHLIVGLLEHHDKSRFEIYGIDNGWDDGSEIRRRINASVHRIVDIARLSDAAAAAAIRENEIDILVNLNGYFGEHRTAVFADRCAAIQVNYLGFPGTLGASYMDYIIADQHVIPESHKEFYSEKVVYLPNCYQANDNTQPIGVRDFTRAELGLPENGFVFSCFNNNYKILPDVFDCWMRILEKVDGSALWLVEDNAIAVANLRKEAAARGINPDRLVFARRVPLSDHLARHRLADLFLDTLPYNAHTTASDALWAGLPVLTCVGEAFAGRVGASLLHAIRLPELITSTLDLYEQTAIDLATHPEKLASIRCKLGENRLTTPLFDTKLFTRHIEAAFAIMHERRQAGLDPEDFGVPGQS
jgi:predicted O-linked N-acetylglucosamine transferase (SPINDLY family)